MAAEPDLYRCETCAVREARATLTPTNWQALEVYDVLARRIVQDLHLAPLVFEVLGVKVTRADARSLFDQLHLIHEARCPRPETNG